MSTAAVYDRDSDPGASAAHHENRGERAARFVDFTGPASAAGLASRLRPIRDPRMDAVVAQTALPELSPLSDDRWANLSVPLGWEPVAAICSEIRENLATSVADSVQAIRAEVPLYRRSVVPHDDLVESVEQNLQMLLLGIAERRGPTGPELETLAALGHRRAHQGVPVDALLQAYHVGYRDLWRRFLKSDDDVARLLLNAAATMWEWTHRVTDGIGRAHAATSQLLAVRAASSRHRFLELLLRGNLDGDEVRTLCRSLGFDARGRFRAAIVCPCELDDDGLIHRFQAELDLLHGVHQAIPHGARVVVLSQHEDQDDVEAAIARVFRGCVVGVGFARDGLAGARLSIGDAERAADAAPGPGVHSFAQGWMWAVLTREEERLHDFLEEGRRVARDHPSLAETVEAFAGNGFSVSATARQLHIHPNTATYRLDRWHALTGWNPRTFDGLARSLTSLRVSLAPETA